MAPFVLALCAVALLLVGASAHAAALIPMDLTQTDHLKSYGVAYWALEKGYRVEWLLNYRSGSFLILDGLDDVEIGVPLQGCDVGGAGRSGARQDLPARSRRRTWRSFSLRKHLPSRSTRPTTSSRGTTR